MDASYTAENILETLSINSCSCTMVEERQDQDGKSEGEEKQSRVCTN